MDGLNLRTICSVVYGTPCNISDYTVEPNRIVIDSRDITTDDLFAAFKGEKADGHDYIESALNKGACCCLAEYIPEGIEGPVIIVKSVEEAMEQIAQEYRSRISIPVIGITGSNGKTTAKEMISSVLGQRFTVLKTDKNLNNQLGVPMTVSSITKNHTAAVIEMGVSKKNDMDVLGKIVRPDIAVFTNIGHAHLEFLDNLEGVFLEKTKVLQYMDADATAVINGDDPFLNGLQCRQRIIRYGFGDNCDVRACGVSFSKETGNLSFTVNCFGTEIPIDAPAYGKHIVYAALEAAAVGTVMDISPEEIIRGIGGYKIVGRRSSVIHTDAFTIIDDCYNANPDSVKSGIDSMMMIPGRHLCILGDMLELGKTSDRLHFEIGKYAAEKGCECVLAYGTEAANIAEGAESIGVYCREYDDFVKEIQNTIREGDVILVKASRSMNFERITEMLRQFSL